MAITANRVHFIHAFIVLIRHTFDPIKNSILKALPEAACGYTHSSIVHQEILSLAQPEHSPIKKTR